MELTRAAGVSRGAFYKSFYLVTDVLVDDIREIADRVRQAMGADIGLNRQIILDAVWEYREKIPLLLKAGMGMELLAQINRGLQMDGDEYDLVTIAWNGIIFNTILYWAERGFTDNREELAARLTALTASLYET